MRKPDAGSETGIAEERKEAILEIPHYIKNKISTISFDRRDEERLKLRKRVIAN